MVYKAEYIWIDGQEPTAKLRSKTKIIADGAPLPEWGFDGSSTNQATGDRSDCVLIPVFSCPDRRPSWWPNALWICCPRTALCST